MNSNNAAGAVPDSRPAETGLDSKYGEIGISAVAAALRYKSEAKAPATPPAAPWLEENTWVADLAA